MERVFCSVLFCLNEKKEKHLAPFFFRQTSAPISFVLFFSGAFLLFCGRTL